MYYFVDFFPGVKGYLSPPLWGRHVPHITRYDGHHDHIQFPIYPALPLGPFIDRSRYTAAQLQSRGSSAAKTSVPGTNYT